MSGAIYHGFACTWRQPGPGEPVKRMTARSGPVVIEGDPQLVNAIAAAIGPRLLAADR